MKMVYLDGSVISRQIASGISNYVVNIFKFFKLYEKRSDINTKLVLNGLPKRNAHFNEAAFPASELIINTFSDLVHGFFSGSRYRGSIFHSPYMFLPPKTKNKINLLTVHDLINFEREFSFRNKFRETFLRLAISRADDYICISNATRNKLIEHFPEISPDRIFVVLQGIDNHFFLEGGGEVHDPKGKPYLLYVGLRAEYKKFDCLLDFFRHSGFKDEMGILCVGGGPFTGEERQKLRDNHLDGVIQHLGYVTNAQLKSLYKNSVALLYTSLQEGFGIPIIEAMACGCPVICGNFSSMKEIGSNFAILVNDFSPDALRDAVHKALQFTPDQKMQARNYAENYSWENTAVGTLKVYEKLFVGL